MSKRQRIRTSGRWRASSAGQSAVELAVAVPAIALLLMAVVDFGRFFYMGIAVHSAARAGAQYGSQNLATAADSTGMTNAATTDWNNSSLTLTVTPSQCTCVSSSSSVSACPTNYCTNDAQATFVEVNTQVAVSSVISYLGIPTSVMNFLGISTSGNFTSQAIMQVQQ